VLNNEGTVHCCSVCAQGHDRKCGDSGSRGEGGNGVKEQLGSGLEVACRHEEESLIHLPPSSAAHQHRVTPYPPSRSSLPLPQRQAATPRQTLQAADICSTAGEPTQCSGALHAVLCQLLSIAGTPCR